MAAPMAVGAAAATTCACVSIEGAAVVLKGGFTDMGPGGWLAACLGLWLVSFPLYLSCRSKIQAAAGSSSKSASSTTPADFTDRLEKLADLRAKGVLTEDEFNDQKSRLLEM